MTWHYRFTPDVGLALAASLFMAILSLYSWRRRGTPAALALAASLLFGALWMLGVAIEVAAVVPATKIAWHKFQAVWQLPAATAMTCFALEYAYPGRWLTRRNLALLALISLLEAILLVIDRSQFLYRQLEVAADGTIMRHFSAPGALLVVYGLGLGLINVAAFLWLFVRSPQHRWPVALMLLGDVAGRSLYALYAFDDTPLASLTLLDAFVLALLLNWGMYAIALFGFRIFDPVPAARRTAIEQMREGMVVFDNRWRVASLNPAAAALLATSAGRARGKTLAEILPALPELSTRLAAATGQADPIEVSLGTETAGRLYTLSLSQLADFRGLPIGRLLLLRDVTEQRRAQAELMGQQAAVAALREREQMARELHDGLGQVLGYLKMQAQAARSLLAQERKAEADDCLTQLAAAAQDAHADVREYIFEASTASPIEQGFLASLRQHLQRFDEVHRIRAELVMGADITDGRFDPAVAVQLLRIVQEALTNARKHACATHVRVSLAVDDGAVEVAIVDNGQGFDPDRAAGDGFGLRFMRERAEQVGGSLQVHSTPGQGAQVIVRAPLRKDGGL